MKLKLEVSATGGFREVIALSCDGAATVGDAAQALVRSGIFAGSNLEEFVALRRGHVTLLGKPVVGSDELLLDPLTPIGASGLQSGWQVTVVPEFDSQAPRPIPILGIVEVMSGSQAGAVFSLIAGSNPIGRDAHSRVSLDDRSVSRRHAVIEINRQIVLHDLGSANGIEAFGQRIETLAIERPTEVILGEVTLRVTPTVASAESQAPLEHRHPHTRSPRVESRFPVTNRELPKPPQPTTPSRIPLLALLAPMMMGSVLFAVTQNTISLIMVAFTPVMMIGTWVDHLIFGKRKLKRESRTFDESLAHEGEVLLELRRQELTTRALESPSLAEIAHAIRTRGELLWARRPEHRNFLEIRFGDGALRSRTRVELPHREDAAADQWEALRAVQRRFELVEPVPVLERLERCGSIGVSGDPTLAKGLARALVLQLTGLQSPSELVVTAFAGSGRDGEEWEWLKWLPHIDPVSSPIIGWQLADHPHASAQLLSALESLIERRQGRVGRGARSVRSHLNSDELPDDEAGAVDKLPQTPAVLVLVLENEIADEHRSRLIALAEGGPDFGVHIIWVARDTARVPAACRTFVEAGVSDQAPSSVGFVRQRETVPLSRLEYIGVEDAEILARSLAPVDDTAARALDETDLPRAVNLRELHRVDLLGGAAPILQHWRATGSIMSAWRCDEDREAIRLAAVVGQSAEGLAEIDLRMHGPHALVGGTTGAGKSEFLQSWIMSLAVNISPDRLTFLLIDYKGGAAFAECVDLPHTVGVVTDLSPHLVRRALTSLRAELRYREELLAEYGAKDLITMERRGDRATPPALIIVIDEFAALASEVPAFVDGVIDIAQRGRSLGLHLIMATQRPAGVITDNLRANTNLRIALRMADEADSADVIGAKDAAFFDAETPGRGVMKAGASRLAHFQTGYLGGRASEECAVSRLEIRSLGFVEGEPWDIPEESPGVTRRRIDKREAARDIERLRDGLIEAAARGGLAAPRRPWLDMLPMLLSLDEAKERLTTQSRAGVNLGEQPVGVLIGMRDRPEAQVQEALCLDLDDVGNAAVFGASGTGKTSMLLSFSASISEQAETDAVHLYAIDAAGGGLAPLLPLPTVSVIASLNDDELVRRVLRQVLGVVIERGARFAAARADGLPAYRRVTGSREPRVILLIDGFSAFRQATEMLGTSDSPLQMLGEIMQAGRAVGVHVVLTANRAGVLPSALAATVQQQFVLRLASQNDYVYLDVPKDALEEAPPGRGVCAGQRDVVQFALVGGSPNLIEQTRALETLAASLQMRHLVPVRAVRNAPEQVLLAELPVEAADRPVFGIETWSFEAVGMPSAGLGVITGPAGSGLSTALFTCATGFARWAALHGETVERVLLSFVPDSAGGLGLRKPWDRVARGVEEVAAVARELILALGGKPPATPAFSTECIAGNPVGVASAPIGVDSAEEGSRSVPIKPPPVFPRTATRGVIVVERPTEAEGTEAMPTLVALAKAARRAEVLVLFEFEQSAIAGVWELFAALKQPQWGLALQPDEGDAGSPFRESFGRVRRASFPPGRGFAVEAGRITPVHIATVKPDCNDE